MPVPRYGVWAATPTSFEAEDNDDDPRSPHIHLKFKNGSNSTRVFHAAINVKSVGQDSRLVYWLVKGLKNDFTDGLKNLERGFHPIAPGDRLGLDYVRSGLITIKEGELLEHDVEGPNNDILDKVGPILQAAIDSGSTTVYLFGSQFRRRDGIHDIHMNQGSLPHFDNGVGQDGAIFFRFPDDHWEAIFLAFASQKIPTDGRGLPAGHAKELVDLLDQQAA
ncbi:hypothetical protein BGZ75_000277 [Mortierella antarctica]|nr:hypothetical protein BGZ75_000277 [Mortierella antarctica]